MPGASRESDERLLAWLALSEQRVPIKEIAARFGVDPRNVEQRLYAIRKADRKEHEETP